MRSSTLLILQKSNSPAPLIVDTVFVLSNCLYGASFQFEIYFHVLQFNMILGLSISEYLKPKCKIIQAIQRGVNTELPFDVRKYAF